MSNYVVVVHVVEYLIGFTICVMWLYSVTVALWCNGSSLPCLQGSAAGILCLGVSLLTFGCLVIYSDPLLITASFVWAAHQQHPGIYYSSYTARAGFCSIRWWMENSSLKSSATIDQFYLCSNCAVIARLEPGNVLCTACTAFPLLVAPFNRGHLL